MRALLRRVPAWVWWGLVLALAVIGWRAWVVLSTPVQVRAAIAELRTTSVSVVGGAPDDVLDEARVRRVIGDRPIVVAVLPEGTDAGSEHPSVDACEDVVRELDDVLAVVYVGGGVPSTCLGSDFPAPDPDLANAAFTAENAWLFRLELDVDAASRFRLVPGSADRTPEVEELVLAFDVDVTRGLTDGVERRELAASPSVLGRTVALLAGVVVGALALVALLQLAVLRLRRRATARRLRDQARLALTVELAAVADAVLRSEPVRVGGDPDELARARVRADVAGRYVLALTEVEAARTEDELAAAGGVVTALRADADASLPDPAPARTTRPATRPVTARRRWPGRRRRGSS